MAITYFGYTTIPGTRGTPGSGGSVNRNKGTIFTCPLSGTPDIKELSGYFYLNSGSGNVRLAIYDTSGNLICQGNAQKAVTGDGSWIGHTSDASELTGTLTLTAGVDYWIVFSFDAGDATGYYYANNLDADAFYQGSNDYTDGFPDPLTISGGYDYSLDLCVRCGVEPAAGGGGLSVSVSENINF